MWNFTYKNTIIQLFLFNIKQHMLIKNYTFRIYKYICKKISYFPIFCFNIVSRKNLFIKEKPAFLSPNLQVFIFSKSTISAMNQNVWIIQFQRVETKRARSKNSSSHRGHFYFKPYSCKRVDQSASCFQTISDSVDTFCL